MEVSGPELSKVLSRYLSGGSDETTKSLIQDIAVPVQIRSQLPSNTSLDHYH
jgi:hypothetical protein